jgi:hypothetical protein
VNLRVKKIACCMQRAVELFVPYFINDLPERNKTKNNEKFELLFTVQTKTTKQKFNLRN